jgi:carboxymethylenebutenolidase
MGGTEIRIKAADSGDFMGYLATPEGGSGPGIVVIQEIFGVNAVMRKITDDLAAQGYLALCPDLFWRQEPGIQITDQTEEHWARAFELFQGFDLDKGVQDLDSTIERLRALDGCSGKVGTVGYCLGGRLALLSATRTQSDASVGYYGVMLHEHTGERINNPCLLHIATQDEFASDEQRAAVHAAWDNDPKVELHDYLGREHAFARVGGVHFHRGSADLAAERTLAFFQAHLS